MDWKFWKSGDDGLGDLDADFDTSSFDAPAGGPDMSQDFSPPQQEPRFSPPPSQQAPAQQPGDSRDLHMELVLSKLDAIKGQLDTLSARVERVEGRLSAAEEQQGPQGQGRGPWYAQQ